MIVSDFMSTDPICIDKNTTVLDAARLMMEKKISVLPVTEDDKLIGVLTQSDFVGKQIDIPHALVSIKQILGQGFHSRDVESIFKEAKEKTVGDVATTNVVTVGAGDSLDDVVNLMIKKNLKRLPVVEGDKIVGIITRRNILKGIPEDMKNILWAVEPNPPVESLERKAALYIKHLNKNFESTVTPYCCVSLAEHGLKSQREIFSEVKERVDSYKIPGMKTTHFIKQRGKISGSKKVKLILDYAKKEKSDLIVVQTKGKTGLDRFFLGSFAESLVLQSPIPVLTVNPSGPVRREKTILFPTDFSGPSLKAFRRVLSLAKKTGYKVIVFHWVDKVRVPFSHLENPGHKKLDEIYTKEHVSEAKKKGKRFTELAEKKSVPCQFVVQSGPEHGADQIAAYADKKKVGLVAMVACSNATSAVLLGSLTRQLIRLSKAPLLSLRES